MFKSIKYVLHENVTNLFRIYSIAKYELLADMRDSKLGLFWNFAHPLIQVLTYWFAFGIVFNRKAVTSYGVTIPYIFWMMGGMVVDVYKRQVQVSRGSYGTAAAYATVLNLITILSLLIFMKLSKTKEIAF